jgi:3-hydroxybutyryl-CoA dehydrogenase
MQIIVLANDSLRKELLNNGVQSKGELIWILDPKDFLNYSHAVACIDLLFEKSEERLNILKQISGLQANLIEAASPDENKQTTEDVFAQFNKKIEWLPDEAGFVTPRVISMIINEAYISLEEGVSSKEEIDKAMKLGTNYPYGPFEWAEKIGQENVASLLQKLSGKDQRYQPSLLMQQVS